LCFLPETPRYFYSKSQLEDCGKVLTSMATQNVPKEDQPMLFDAIQVEKIPGYIF
jgi:hypothetical protein